jgi:hypothetical protein
MKLLFASLICHRDVDIFEYNWFCSRSHLDNGFDIPHLLLSDGSLTDEDRAKLSKLPNVIVEDEPITLYDVPKAALLGKLECFKRGFEKYGAKRVVVLDCDIFFLKNWDPDLRKICTSDAICLRDWGSSLGPNVAKYKNFFGVHEDVTTPNCNTGIMSMPDYQFPKLSNTLSNYLALEDPFLMMEDQGAWFASFYGEITYINGIKCAINNAEYSSELWDWLLSQRGVHLMGMRTRIDGLRSLISKSLSSLPDHIHLSQFTPVDRSISWGLMEYETYHFNVPLQKIPTTHNNKYITDALYLHGGSWAKWELPSRCSVFRAKLVCMDTGIKSNVKPAIINNNEYPLDREIEVPLTGELHIATIDGPGTHLAFLNPRVEISKYIPDISLQKVAT